MIYKGMVEGMYDVHCPTCNNYLFSHHSSYQGVYSCYCEKCKRNVYSIDLVEVRRFNYEWDKETKVLFDTLLLQGMK